MDILDIIFSKNFRSLPKDKKDITDILIKFKISRQEIFARHIQLMRQQDYDVRPMLEQRYMEFLHDFGHLLK